ncbi:MAG: AlpA family phage regulatory protein [Rhodoferax sp.]|uniref:helix-turn-helix transcriptional regulator n=1 Tax=Rhodoferax sp. TaxID=50421 RepID=UPI00261D8266|nr:AlpA family phage regulatory protein [Rhodoferax sp.]MDD2879256.1 AlpA family phage regulatory protein [Rhodoferax sp.]
MKTPEEISLLRLQQVITKTGLPRSSVYALIAQGAFPKPVQLSAKAVAWKSNAIDSWINSRVSKCAA